MGGDKECFFFLFLSDKFIIIMSLRRLRHTWKDYIEIDIKENKHNILSLETKLRK